MSAEAPLEPHWSAARDRIRTLRTQARSRAWQAVYVEVVAAYREFGKGFDRSNLWNMRAFYLLLPILDALRQN